MIGDIILIKPRDYKKAKSILPIFKNGNRVIGIGGISGVSKTETAMCLQQLLHIKNRSTLLINMDDYYFSNFMDRNRIRKKNGLKTVGIKEIDWKQIKKIIKDFKNRKESINLQMINKYTNSFFECIAFNTDKVDYLIIEGLFVGHLKKLGILNYYVHLDGNIEQTSKFRKERMKENENNEFRKKIVQREANIVVQLKKYADMLVEF